MADDQQREPDEQTVTAPVALGLNDTLADRVVAAQVRASLFGRESAPVTIGRFRVLRALGAGAMGTVWLCRDDELAREVAVKLLRGRGGVRADARMVREARALARLAHPNVVVVHEVGSSARGVFVAMEYVRGTTSTAWLAARPRAVAEILDVFVQAGRGLAAAHRVQIVHRDFKPDNVLIGERSGDEGRARVVDFGLARTDAEAADDGAPEHAADESLTITRSGALLGTPAYMAPEQLEGAPADARSDQFAYCVALFEALHGVRPFAGEHVLGLLEAIRGGPPRRNLRGLAPAQRAAIERGLACDPAARWPSMDALLAVLAPRAPRTRAPWIAATVIAGGGLAAAWAWARNDACAEPPAQLAAAWDAVTRAGVEHGFANAEAPYAAAVWNSTSARLDGYAAELLAQARTVCVTDRARDDPSYRAAAQACLEDARSELVALAERLARAHPIAIAGALHQASALPDVLGCADPRRLALAYPQPRDAARSAEARESLSAARDTHSALAFGPPTREVGTAIEEASAAAEHSAALALADGDRGLAAAASIVHARLLIRRGDNAGAGTSLRRAIEHASAVDDPSLRIQAMVMQTYVIGLDRDRADEAYLLGDQVRASIEAGAGFELALAQLDNNLGTVAARDRRGRHQQAEQHHRAALAGFVALLGEEHPDALASRINLASALAQAGRGDEARVQLEAAREPALRVWGERHPSTARLYGVLGNAELRAGRLVEAEAWMRRALAVQEQAFGPDDAEVASALYNLAMVLRRTEDSAGAVASLRRGLAIRERLLGPNAAELIAWLVALGEAELHGGAPAQAEPVLRRALSLCETDGAPPADFARVRAALARAMADRDRSEAIVHARAARAAYLELGDERGRSRMDELLAELHGSMSSGVRGAISKPL